MNFEAGAISKTLESAKVAPFLVGVERSELRDGPLAQFQNTVFDMNDVRLLMLSINSAHHEPLNNANVVKTFQACWRSLEEAINGIDLTPIVEEVEIIKDENEQVEMGGGDLHELEVSILMLLAAVDGNELKAEKIASEVEEHLTKVNHYLSKLETGRLISNSIVMNDGIYYFIVDNGREYLVEHGLV